VPPVDYIMRLIEQFFLVLSRILFKKNTQKYAEALSETETAYKNLLGLDARQVHSLSFDELIGWLKMGGRFDAEKCLILAALLKEDAEIHELAGRPMDDGLHAEYAKAFFLYREAVREDESPESGRARSEMKWLVKKLDSSRLAPPRKLDLFRYHESAGEFGLAEDLLYELAKVRYPGIRKEGREFYRRLIAKSDGDLLEGNLPRKEVEEGMASFQEEGAEK
jgi:hypothetical protein